MDRASRTALGAALYRAAHQLLDVPPIFRDPLALRIVGPEAERGLRDGQDPHLGRSELRAFVAVRSRFAEDRLAEAHARGTRQYVLLGAGLDTFAYRAALPGLAVFEVDHPATQAWKLGRLAVAGIGIPGSAVHVPVDFERERVAAALAGAGFDAARPAFLAWLGVTPYLEPRAVMETLGFAAGLARGSEIVFDFLGDGGEAGEGPAREALARRVAAAGEPFRSAFEPAALAKEMRRLGFSEVEGLGAEALGSRYLAGRSDGLRLPRAGRMMRARA